jgi:hypothetical protein
MKHADDVRGRALDLAALFSREPDPEILRDLLRCVPGVTGIDVRVVWDPPWDPDAMMSSWAKDQLRWRR